MSTLPLETAAHPEQLRRVVIEPLSRVEGHGKVTLLLDEDGHVQQARLHIVEIRAFEKFIQGRPYWEVPVMVQRLCGICPVSHHLAAVQGARPGGRRDDAHAHGGEDPPPDALRADPAVPRAAFLPSVRRRTCCSASVPTSRAATSWVSRRRIPTSPGRACCCASTARKSSATRRADASTARARCPDGVNKSLTAAERDELHQEGHLPDDRLEP